MNPYLVLNVPIRADDKTIRQAFLNAIKQTPPESHPKEFQLLTEAYEAIKDESKRQRLLLTFENPSGNSPLETLLRTVANCPPPKPLPFSQFKEFLRACAKS